MPSRQPPSPSSPPNPHPHPHLPVVAAAAVAAVAAVLVAAAAAAGLVFLWLRRRQRRRGKGGGGGEDGEAAAVRRIPYQQLRRATGNFGAGSKLGQGGFGAVFRGELPRSGEAVAVKVMDAAGSLQGEREFHNELALAAHLLARSPPSGSVLLPFAYALSAPPPPSAAPRRRRRMALVYELMPNGSLQDALLGRRCPELVAEWPRRLAVARDVAAALHYLHAVVQPPVIHGDVKPSNVLLDAALHARLADFGLARVKSDEPSSGPAEADAAESGANCNGHASGGAVDDDVSVAGESTATAAVNGEGNGKSPEEEDDGLTATSPAEAASTCGFDRTSIDSGRECRSCNGGNGRKKGGGGNGGAAASAPGSDWWWRQDNGGGGGVKDYVMEWIRSEIKKERPKSDWIAGAAAPSAAPERKKQKRRAREWWREEFTEELAKKQKRRALAKSRSEPDSVSGMQWWERDDDVEEKRRSRWRMMKSWSRRSSNGNGSADWWVDGARRSSRDWASGEFVPKSGGAVSSTPSMRGTVCYVAPEYGGGGPLSEKCDIYSYGVLLLVLISGRRPLQVTASPMSEFEKASLISWARHLAHVGRLLDLVDPALQDIDRDQVLLCITVALLCIQRSPARRPSSEELLGMLACEGEPPHLPLEFSPSPPGGFPFKSRKKAR